ncbi:sialate O-acetylesterase [Thermostilla marina]
MHTFRVAILVAVSLGCAAALRPAAADEPVHLFILSGQSNMQGLNPDLSFTPTVEKAFGADKVVVVKDALGGQPIRRWYKQWKPAGETKPWPDLGDLYDRLMEKVRAAIEGKELASVTFVWMQGEKDAREGHGEVYAESLKGLIRQLQHDLGRDDINVVIGRVNDFDMKNERYPHWTKVREAQVAVAESLPHAAWVDTDDLNNKERNGQPIDDLHMTPDGYKILGKRFAEAAIRLIRERE